MEINIRTVCRPWAHLGRNVKEVSFHHQYRDRKSQKWCGWLLSRALICGTDYMDGGWCHEAWESKTWKGCCWVHAPSGEHFAKTGNYLNGWIVRSSLVYIDMYAISMLWSGLYQCARGYTPRTGGGGLCIRGHFHNCYCNTLTICPNILQLLYCVISMVH